MEPKTVLGVDIGGTTTRVGIVADDGCLLTLKSEPTPTDGSPSALGRLLRRLRDYCEAEQPISESIAGVALPGIRAPDPNVMHRAVHLPRLEGVNVGELFADALGVPVTLESDVLAAGYGQWTAESNRPERFLYLSLGTGVGGCVIVDGRLVRHTNGAAGHFGFMVVDTAPDAPLDAAGLAGTVEAYLCGDAFRNASEADREKILPGRLAIGLHQMCAIYLPDMIAIGGGIATANPRLVELADEAFRARPYPLRATRPRVQLARLKSDEAGVIGSAFLALTRGA